MATAPRFTYNISKQNNDRPENESYYTYNQNNNSQNNQNQDIIYQNQDNIQNSSFLNRTSPLPFNTMIPLYENNIINNTYSNLNYNNNENRFSRLNSRLDEINSKINKEKIDKETFIHNKINNTELMLKTNNENCLKKISEMKNNIKSLYNFLDQIK